MTEADEIKLQKISKTGLTPQERQTGLKEKPIVRSIPVGVSQDPPHLESLKKPSPEEVASLAGQKIPPSKPPVLPK